MGDGKRYYWLKFKEDFFESKRIKKLRKLAGGDTYTIIYLKMQLKALKSNGVLTFTGIEKTFAEEVALDIDEDAENVAVTLNFLLMYGLIETSDNIQYSMPYVAENTRSETSAAERMRKCRENQKLSNTCNNVTDALQPRYVDIDTDINKDINKDINTDIDTKTDTDVSIGYGYPIDTLSKPPKESKHRYGEYNHVLLTDAERDKLLNEYGDAGFTRMVRNLDEYIQMKGAKYKDHYLTMLNWARRDAEKKSGNQSKGANQLDRLKEIINESRGNSQDNGNNDDDVFKF